MANLSRKIEKHLGRKLNFDTDVVLQNDGAGSYIREWNVEEAQPELKDLEKIDVTAEVALAEVLSNRKAEYPSVGDQLDMLMKDMKNGTTTHQEACEAVKTKFTKG